MWGQGGAQLRDEGGSHVLAAIGTEPVTSGTSLRLTLGHTTTDADLDHVIAVLPRLVANLRGALALAR